MHGDEYVDTLDLGRNNHQDSMPQSLQAIAVDFVPPKINNFGLNNMTIG